MTDFNLLSKVRLSKKIVFNIIISLLLIYFTFHSIYGNRGIIAYFKLSQQLEKSAAELASLRAEHIETAHKVKLLRPETLDKDMLDQQVRNILGMAASKEQVFTRNKNKEQH